MNSSALQNAVFLCSLSVMENQIVKVIWMNETVKVTNTFILCSHVQNFRNFLFVLDVNTFQIHVVMMNTSVRRVGASP